MSNATDYNLPDQVVHDLVMSMENIGTVQEAHGQDGLIVLNFSASGLIAASAGGIITAERLDVMEQLVADLRQRLQEGTEHGSQCLFVAKMQDEVIETPTAATAH